MKVLSRRIYRGGSNDSAMPSSGIAYSGDKAVEAAGRLSPDLVLMDIKLKGDMDGVEAARQIRDSFNIPVIYLTAYTDDMTLKFARTAEPYGYIVKPFGDRELHSNIDMALYKHKAEQALKESEERYRAIFEQAADSIVLIDGETGELVEFNDKAHKNLGYTSEEFKKLEIPDFEAIETAEEVRKHFDKIIRRGPDVFQTKQRRKDGEVRDILVSSRAISIGGKDFIQSIWRDITEQKRAEKVLRFSLHFLERANLKTSKVPLLEEFVKEIKEFTECEAVGIRILDESGNIPYEAYAGFSKEFYELENSLSVKSDKCMCVNVIKGQTDSKLPFCTEGGSFYMNGMARFLATVPEED